MRYALIGALVSVVFALMATSALAKKAHVNIVSQSGAPAGEIPSNTSYFTTIQSAVDASKAGDWVLIEPGVYDEEVKVEKAQSGIFIRGMDRNTVILDGQHKPLPGGSNGIEVYKANNVWIENLTARNFDRAEPDGPNGNEIWWNGGAESEKIGAHGWYGSYLTAYDDGLNGGYGIFTNNETKGSWNEIYASGFNDSGIYLGACWECRAHISNATIEYNAVGYSGSNSGGELVIEKSTFRHNSAGIVPNSENPGDGPPPQNGKCHGHKPSNPTPKFSTTAIERCTVIKENLVTENDDLSVPANPSTSAAPWGVGVELPGDYADLVENNTITNNPNNGVLGFEYPNPFPPTEQTIYFALAGNRISNNTFSNNGYSGYSYAGDVTLQGGIFSSKKSPSTNNCLSGNSFADATYPAEIEGTWGCQNATTPAPNNGFGAVEYLIQLQAESEAREAVGQADPPPQPTMPEPCKGVPTNPLCP
ncbi:MAG: DUF1565 domain-containing protein [Solirubrobacteraceae bacterium]